MEKQNTYFPLYNNVYEISTKIYLPMNICFEAKQKIHKNSDENSTIFQISPTHSSSTPAPMT